MWRRKRLFLLETDTRYIQQKLLSPCSRERLKTAIFGRFGENELVVSDRETHLGVTRARKNESEINISDRISLARRTSYHLMNTGLHGTNVLKPETSYVIYKCDVISRMIYGLEVIHLTKTQLNQLERFT